MSFIVTSTKWSATSALLFALMFVVSSTLTPDKSVDEEITGSKIVIKKFIKIIRIEKTITAVLPAFPDVFFFSSSDAIKVNIRKNPTSVDGKTASTSNTAKITVAINKIAVMHKYNVFFFIIDPFQ